MSNPTPASGQLYFGPCRCNPCFTSPASLPPYFPPGEEWGIYGPTIDKFEFFFDLSTVDFDSNTIAAPTMNFCHPTWTGGTPARWPFDKFYGVAYGLSIGVVDAAFVNGVWGTSIQKRLTIKAHQAFPPVGKMMADLAYKIGSTQFAVFDANFVFAHADNNTTRLFNNAGNFAFGLGGQHGSPGDKPSGYVGVRVSLV